MVGRVSSPGKGKWWVDNTYKSLRHNTPDAATRTDKSGFFRGVLNRQSSLYIRRGTFASVKLSEEIASKVLVMRKQKVD